MRPEHSGSGTVLFPRLGGHERSVLADALRAETVGGGLLLAATVLALILANTPARHAYARLQHLAVGPAALDLHLTLEQWAADGLLAVFFFVAGLELKRELVAGDMRHLSTAIVPIAAAIGGMAVPVLVDLAFTAGRPTVSGWAIPCSTDIAFALAILAITGRFMPTPLRAFLLTLAVVDDLGSIIIIAVAYTNHIHLLPLAGAIVGLGVFWLLLRAGITRWWLVIPVAIVVWALVHASGVHATAAGVSLGLLIPVTAAVGDRTSLAERIEHLVRPFSAGVAVPLFALLAAGVAISASSLRQVVTGHLGLGVLLGLVVGKTIGVFGVAYLTARFTRATLSPELTWSDIFAVAVLSGVGFTVSLLISDLAFGSASSNSAVAKTAVLLASLLAGLAASALIAIRNAHYRQIQQQERATDPVRRVRPAASAPDRSGPPWRSHRRT